MGKVRLDEIIFNAHVLLFLMLIIPFFIPLSVWPGRIAFHLWYIVIVVVSEILMGIILLPWMSKHGIYRIVCPLTTLMQYVRGYPPSDPKNFDYGFFQELGQRMKIDIPRGTVSVMNFLILIIVATQYFY